MFQESLEAVDLLLPIRGFSALLQQVGYLETLGEDLTHKGHYDGSIVSLVQDSTAFLPMKEALREFCFEDAIRTFRFGLPNCSCKWGPS